jgi:hypothetical protein
VLFGLLVRLSICHPGIRSCAKPQTKNCEVRRNTRLLAQKICGGALVFPAAMAAAEPRISEAVLKHAIDAYAPVLICHEQERYLPTCVESYREITEPFSYIDRDSGQRYTGLRHKPSGTSEHLARQRRGDPERAKAYVNVKVGADTTDIQYWFLYAYNGPATAYIKRLNWRCRYELGELGAHEGDWEHVTVTVDNTTGLAANAGVYLATHATGDCHRVADCTQHVDGDPRVRIHASRNGHSSYRHAGRAYHVTFKAGLIEFRLLNDTSASGIAVDFRHRCEIVGIHGDETLASSWNAHTGFREPEYVREFPGRWGRIVEKPHPYADVLVVSYLSASLLKAVGAYDELTFEAGPYPPWSKASWAGPE